MGERMREYRRHTYSAWFALALAINYTLGSGFLGIPQAMHGSGLLLGIAVVLAVSQCSVWSCEWIVESVARTNAVLDQYEKILETDRRPAVRRHREQIAKQLRDANAILIAGGHVAIILNRLKIFGVLRCPMLAGGSI